MKNIFFTACFLLAAGTSWGQCPNGDLEAGAITPPWSCYVGGMSATGVINPSSYVPVPSSPRHNIMVAGTNDPIVGAALPVVINGSYSLMLGNNAAGSQTEIISYTFNLPYDFSFLYAMVLSGTHGAAEDAFFSYWISLTDILPSSTMAGNLLAMEEFRTDRPGLTASGGVLYKPWSKECVMEKFPSLVANIGMPVTIYFATSDCAFGGHLGYAYIDELCKNNLPLLSFTAPASIGHAPASAFPVYVDGTASRNIREHYFKVEECTSTGTVIPGGASDSTATVHGMPGIIDLRSTLSPSLFAMTTYYKISLCVTDCGGIPLQSSKIIYVN